jgi:2-C-methyl-D-erythritol 4-phosphate cytidylyltransferase
VESDGIIQSIPQRDKIWRGQTPQAFRFNRLYSAYMQLGPERLTGFTDDCGVVLAADPFARIKIVRGAAENIKITEESDLVIADEFFRLRTSKLDTNMKGIDLKDRAAVIFGGTAGIGKAITQVLNDAGCAVHVASRSTDCDIRKFSDVEQAIGQANHRFGSIDFVINTAGTLLKKSVKDQTSDDFAEQVAINLVGALNIAKASHPHLLKTKGMLLNFSSSSYTRGRGGYVPYSASKAAIVNMTQGLAEEWQDDGIRVNCVVPGRTDTEMRRSNFYNEDPATLLSPYEVALQSAKVLGLSTSGTVIRV